MTNQELVASIKRGFSNLTRFSGRDSRSQFWPYAIFTYFAQTAIGIVVALPIMMAPFENLQRLALEQQMRAETMSDSGSPAAEIPPPLPADIFPDMTSFFWVCGILAVLLIAFMAAAVTRRLHDTGRSGFWGLVPLPFLATGFLLFPKLFAAAVDQAPEMPSDEITRWMLMLFANNLIYILLVITLIVFLALPERDEDNRYGPPRQH